MEFAVLLLWIGLRSLLFSRLSADRQLFLPLANDANQTKQCEVDMIPLLMTKNYKAKGA